MEERNKHILTALLLGLRDEILQRFENLGRKWSKMEHIDNEFEIKAAIHKLTADLSRFECREVKEIEAIDKALNRVHNNMYGICETCGANISEQHLLAVPWATECLHCTRTDGILMPGSVRDREMHLL